MHRQQNIKNRWVTFKPLVCTHSRQSGLYRHLEPVNGF